MGLETWHSAQLKEREFHTHGYVDGVEHYRDVYKQYFEWLRIERNLLGKKVIEIGPADIPALSFCKHIGESYIIEPMASGLLKRFNIPIIQEPAENVDFIGDEVWMMNLLQHVQDPFKIVEQAKKSKIVRWFEPVNYGIDECHLWNLTHEMFKDWFGVSNKYGPNPHSWKFHQWECSYGVWLNPNL